MPKAELASGPFRIVAEVAATDADRERGLMFRKSMPEHEGMLFVFDRPERVCMWMRNTYLPLSVAFLDDSGAVINLAEMTPLSEKTHCAARAARFALEMNAGWFTKRGVGPGNRISGTDRLPRRQ